MSPDQADTWIKNRVTTVFEPVPETPPPSPESDPEAGFTHGKDALDAALDKIVLAVATLNRAGPFYARRTPPLWCFCAGSWTRAQYEGKIEEVKGRLGKQESVAYDVAKAGDLLDEAVKVLRREGDARDARDLVEAMEHVWQGL